MNNLIRVEEKQLIIAEEAINKIKELETKKKLIEQKEKDFKEKVLEIMEENGITNFESNDKTLKITRTPGTTVTSFNTSEFEKDYKELFQKYYNKETTRKSSIRITVKEKKDE